MTSVRVCESAISPLVMRRVRETHVPSTDMQLLPGKKAKIKTLPQELYRRQQRQNTRMAFDRGEIAVVIYLPLHRHTFWSTF